jgi:hypothetical protein
MSKILKVSESNYRVKVQDGGTITFDTGTENGIVIVTGDLRVMGNTTTIDTANMTIEDNIILLNKGEVGVGITETYSGIDIDRGSLENAQFLFDESLTHWDQTAGGGRGTGQGGANTDGTFVLQTADGILSSLKVAGIVAPEDLDLTFDLRDKPYALRIANADPTAYATRVFVGLNVTAVNDNLIPNRKFITQYVAASGLTPGVADVDKIYKTNGLAPVAGGLIQTEVIASATKIEFLVRSGSPSSLQVRSEINSAGLFVDNVNSFLNTVQTKPGSAATLLLKGDSQNVEVDSFFNLTNQITTPLASSGRNKLFSRATTGPGKTGLFFVNTTTADELVAKDRALLFSILF